MLLLGACVGELAEPQALVAPLEASVASLGPRVRASTPSRTEPASARPRGDRRKGDRGPSNGRFIAAHFGAGVASTMVIQTMTYSIARRVGQTGQGLGPVIGALALGAFGPPILNYTFQWAMGRTVAPGRDRFWPGFLTRQVVHLGVFVGAVLGGADFNKPGHMAAIVVGEAFANSGFATMTAELARRPSAPPSTAQLPSGQGTGLGHGRKPFELMVPVLEVQF